MWLLLPALSLAIVHIAGDNAGVVPDSAAKLGGGIWPVIFLAYFFFGAALTATVAWIGAETGQELGVTARRLFGCRGKKLLAVVILGVSIPASALTGGYYAGWLLTGLTGLSHPLAVAVCLLVFSLLAAGHWDELMVVSSWCSLLLLPALLMLMFLGGGGTTAAWDGRVDWRLALALFGYNAGGIRPPLVAEAAACLRKKTGRAIGLAVAAKMVEGAFTVAMAYIVLSAGASGPLALAQAATRVFGAGGGWVFTFILLCTFANAMIPAMTVNARQVACCTNLPYWPSLAVAGVCVYLATFLGCGAILDILAVAGPATAIFVGYTACRLHKSAAKQQ